MFGGSSLTTAHGWNKMLRHFRKWFFSRLYRFMFWIDKLTLAVRKRCIDEMTGMKIKHYWPKDGV
jgi:hypothetical protein